MTSTSKLKVEKGGTASLSVIDDESIDQACPEITIDKPETSANDLGEDGLIRVSSARQSRKLDSTNTDTNVLELTEQEPSPEFLGQLGELVNEITSRVLMDQPTNIYEFLAEYLEDKVRVEKKKCKVKKRHKGVNKRMLERSNSQLAMQGVGVGDRKLNLDLPARSAEVVGASPDILQVEYGVADTEPLCVFTGSTDIITQCSIFKNYVISSSLDTNIRIFDQETGKQKLTIPNHGPINCFVLVPIDDKKILILIGSTDGQVPGWRVKFGAKCSAKFTVIIPMHQPNPIRAMSVSPRGKYLASGCCFEMTQISLWGEIGTAVRGTLKTWDMDNIINYVDHPQHYYDDVEHLCLKTYKQIIARGVGNNKNVSSSYARLSKAGEEEAQYGIRAVAFTPDDSKILVGFGHPTQSDVKDMKIIALLESTTLETLWLQYAYFHQINAIVSSPEKDAALSGLSQFMIGTEFHLNKCTVEKRGGDGYKDQKVRVKFPWRIDFSYGEHQGATFSPDGSLVATACGRNLLVFRSTDGQQVANYEAHSRVINHVTFSDDGKYIATASSDKTIKLWHAPQKMTSLTPFTSPRISEYLSPRNNEKGAGKAISLSPNLYQVHHMTSDSENGSRSCTPDPGRHLIRHEEPRALSPSAYGFHRNNPTSSTQHHNDAVNPFEKTLQHIHMRADKERAPSPSNVRRVGETVMS